MANEIRMELDVKQVEACRRCFLSDDWRTGVLPLLYQMRDVIFQKLGNGEDEKALYRAQGELARVKIFLDFAKKIMESRTTDQERDSHV